MKILIVTQEQARTAGWVLTSFGDHDGIPATVRNMKVFPNATIIEVDSEYTLQYYEDMDIAKTEQLQAELQAEARRIAQERVLDAEIAKDPYLSAMADVEARIDSGEINENARKALRDRV